jgi:hypothetical protein
LARVDVDTPYRIHISLAVSIPLIAF